MTNNLKTQLCYWPVARHLTGFTLLRVWGLIGIGILGFSFKAHSQLKVKRGRLRVQYNALHPANTIISERAMGAGVDGHDYGDNARMFRPENIKFMLSSGLRSLSYRLRTELGQEAWHWNPIGKWSENGKDQGYWTSDNTSSLPIQLSYGYSLPRRGSTFDQAGNIGYSRMDDGDSLSFWKSNPYLDHRFTHEPDSLHPQWVAIDLGKQEWVNTLVIDWGDPYALDFYLEYADSSENDFSKSMKILDAYQPGFWHPISGGKRFHAQGGHFSLSLPGAPISLRMLRIICTRSSATAPVGALDSRDSAGYAIHEISLGFLNKGTFTDYIRHDKSNAIQSPIFVSTTDPWHRALDRDSDTEQPGIDFIFHSPLSGHLPVLFPLPLVYDTPENAESLMLYAARNHYPINEWELGEEPDGQNISPQDFASLYVRLAIILHGKNSKYRVGGPSFQSLDEPYEKEENTFFQKTWIKNFLETLKKGGNSKQFQFFSFECYPFDNVCDNESESLITVTHRFTEAYKGITQGIFPAQFPVYLTEYGYSVLAAEPEVRIEGALLNADLIGQFFSLGGKKTFLYGYEPGILFNESGCGWGNLMLFGMEKDGQIHYSTGLYHSAQLYAKKWARPAKSPLKIYPSQTNLVDSQNRSRVGSYALKRPNGKWGILIINKDSKQNFKISLEIENIILKKSRRLWKNLEILQYSEKQYHWMPNEILGHPDRNFLPTKVFISKNKLLEIPPYSITVVNEKGN